MSAVSSDGLLPGLHCIFRNMGMRKGSYQVLPHLHYGLHGKDFIFERQV
jgi:hypothetical protein